MLCSATQRRVLYNQTRSIENILIHTDTTYINIFKLGFLILIIIIIVIKMKKILIVVSTPGADAQSWNATDYGLNSHSKQ